MLDRHTDSVGKRGRRRCQLVVMVKEPVTGRVKTRLARDIGAAAAAGFYRHNLKSVIARLSNDTRWQTQLSVAPALAVASRLLPSTLPRIAQGSGDLGARMQAVFGAPGAPGTGLSSVRPGPIVIIGTDIPEVRPCHIAAAFSALGDSDMVFGPATDGGFWLVGMRRSPRVIEAFRQVRWSAAETLVDCLAGLSGCRVAQVATLRDADDAADLHLIGHAVGRRILPISIASPEARQGSTE